MRGLLDNKENCQFYTQIDTLSSINNWRSSVNFKDFLNPKRVKRYFYARLHYFIEFYVADMFRIRKLKSIGEIL